jgi:hypothetical protein
MKGLGTQQKLKHHCESSELDTNRDSQNASANDNDTSNIMDFDPPISPVPRDTTSEDRLDSESPVQKWSKVTVEEIPDVDSPWQSQAEDDV